MFSKYDVYSTVQSIYCYRDTNVLKNKLNIQDFDTLKQFEEEIVSAKSYKLIINPISGHFTKTHLFNIHRYLFEDVYPFAGKIRIEQIYKGDTMFYPPNCIDNELNKVFDKIKSYKNNIFTEEDLFDFTAYIMAELNIIHPFREGNGRTIREFIRQWMLRFGYSLNWGNASRDDILNVSVMSVDNYEVLVPILKMCVLNTNQWRSPQPKMAV